MRTLITTLSTALIATMIPFTSACDAPSEFDAELPDADAELPDADSELADETSPPQGHVLARAWLHAFHRYLAGFPGGASPLEREFADRLESEELTDAELRAFVGNVEATLGGDLAASEVDDLELDEPLTAELLVRLLPAPSRPLSAAPPPPSAGCPPIGPFDTNAKYRIKFEGISSLKPPTNDYEYVPYDPQWEEAYITWSLFTPGSRSSGRTNVLKTLVPGLKLPFSSGHAAPSSSGTISSDSLLLYRVVEQDGSFYNSALTAAQAAASTMAPMIDWAYVNLNGHLPTEIAAVYDTLSKSGSANDDVFELEQSGVTEKRLWEITNGCTQYPAEMFPFSVPSGNYWEYAMRLYDSNSKWRAWVSYNRI